MPGTMVGTEDIMAKKKNISCDSLSLYFSERKINIQNIKLA